MDGQMYIITKHGTRKNGSFDDPEALIFELSCEGGTIKYSLPDDLRTMEVHDRIRSLHELIRKHIIPDDEMYFSTMKCVPRFVSEVGINSDTLFSKEKFERILRPFQEDPTVASIINQYLYLEDVRVIISAVQNLLIGLENDFITYYRTIATAKLFGTIDWGENKVWKYCGAESFSAANAVSSYFTKANSILDLMTKIAFEFESKHSDFLKYRKLSSSKILYGDRKHISLNETISTIFEHDALIKTIESVRNEVIHNGTWEPNPTIYIRIKDKEIFERFMIFPDLTDGNYDKYVNRYHFFGKGLQVNQKLPNIHREFMLRIVNTVTKMEELYI